MRSNPVRIPAMRSWYRVTKRSIGYLRRRCRVATTSSRIPGGAFHIISGGPPPPFRATKPQPPDDSLSIIGSLVAASPRWDLGVLRGQPYDNARAYITCIFVQEDSVPERCGIGIRSQT